LLNDDAFININKRVADLLDGIASIARGMGGLGGMISNLSILLIGVFRDKIALGLENIGVFFRSLRHAEQDAMQIKNQAAREAAIMLAQN
jgi:hypothetical protein